MIDNQHGVPAPADTYFDHSELMTAMRDPQYATSARYRDEVASKLARSQAEGRIGTMGEFIDQRVHTVSASNLAEGIYGGAQPLPSAAPSPFGMTIGTFKSVADMQAAVNAVSFADPTYRQAVIDKLARSVREGTLDQAALAQAAHWAAEAEAQAAR